MAERSSFLGDPICQSPRRRDPCLVCLQTTMHRIVSESKLIASFSQLWSSFIECCHDQLCIHEIIRSASPATCGILPSARSFSILEISARLLAFWIISCTLFFSLSVSCVRIALPPVACAFEPAPLPTSIALLLTPLIFCASSVGSSCVPNSCSACSRSTCRMRWKSRKRNEGMSQMMYAL
jgi:hypothetical protein